MVQTEEVGDVLGTIAILSAGASVFLDETIRRVQEEDGWHRLLVWSGDTAHIPASSGFDVVCIPPAEFDHGTARNTALSNAKGSYLVLLSDDATPDGDEWCEVLRREMLDRTVGAVFGRQRPREDASLGEKIFREYCYPDFPMGAESGSVRGRAFPVSDAHAAYRIDALRAVGGFPSPCAYGEDRMVAEKLLENGWLLRYAPGAVVKHSHRADLRSAFLRGYNAGGTGVSFNSPRGALSHVVQFAVSRFGVVGLAAAIKDFGFRWFGYRLGRLAWFLRLHA